MADQKALKKRLKVLMNKPENQVCADCPEKQPRWASLIVAPPGSPLGKDPMGAFMCLECSGSHRRLGVHITFVRSVNLDSWKEREVLAMEKGGNKRVNALFEALLERYGVSKPQTTASGFERERFIRDKYERRRFYDPSGLANCLPDEDDDDDEEEEEVVPVRQRTRPAKLSSATVRAPSEAAKRRAESRQARLASPRAEPDKPKRISERRVVAPAPATAPAALGDLLDFASFPEVGSEPTKPAPATNKTLDLFADMTVSTPAPAAPPAQSSNDHIMSLFNTPQMNQTAMMPGNMMMGGGGGGAVAAQPMNAAMMQQQQQQMMMMQQQQMMMMQQASLAQQQQQQGNMNMVGNNNMMMMNGGMPNSNMMQQQQMNPRSMMMQPGMMPNNNNNNNNMMMQNNPGMVPMGSGPSMSAMQNNATTTTAPKEDPFAQFGFNAFRS